MNKEFMNREDALMWSKGLKIEDRNVEEIIADAEKLRLYVFRESDEFKQLRAERDRARETAVKLEQELAGVESNLEQTALLSAQLQKALLKSMQSLISAQNSVSRRVLRHVLRVHTKNTAAPVREVVDEVANLYGVKL